MAVLVLADAPVPGACLPALEPLLGADGCARLQAVLVRRAAAWAAEVAPGRAFVRRAPADGRVRAVRRLLGRGRSVIVFAQRGSEPSRRAADRRGRGGVRARRHRAAARRRHGRAAAVGAAHAAAALADLAEGCDATFGPALDGGFYLAGLAAPHAGVFALSAGGVGRARLLNAVLARARELGLELGLLRYERELRRPLDVARAAGRPARAARRGRRAACADAPLEAARARPARWSARGRRGAARGRGTPASCRRPRRRPTPS